MTKKFMLTPSAPNTNAKYALDGELFARMELTSELSDDTTHGRLILQSVHSVLIAPANENSGENELPKKVSSRHYTAGQILQPKYYV